MANEEHRKCLCGSGHDSFQCDETHIHIHNSNGGRLSAYFGWLFAGLLILLPFGRAFLPGTMWVAFDQPGFRGWFGLIVYLFAIFGCISAGFWWSTIWVNLKTREVERTGRWGPFRTRTVVPLTAFDQVELQRDLDGDTTVALAGSQHMQIVRGRSRKESVRIARELAARVSLPVIGEDADDGEVS